MNVSSEMLHSLLPVFMVSALGAGALAVRSAFGLFNLAGGCAMLATSMMLAGLWWERLGVPSTFYAAAAFSAAAMLLLAAKPADTVPIECSF